MRKVVTLRIKAGNRIVNIVEVSRARLLGSAIFATAIFTVLSFYAYHGATGGLDKDSLRLLENYLQNRVVSASTEAVHIAKQNAEKIADAKLNTKVKFLVDELVKVRSYEQQLQTRADAIDAILDHSIDLSKSRKSSIDSQYNGQDASIKDEGVGGGDFLPSAREFHEQPLLRKTGSAQAVSERLDSQLQSLQRIPIGAPVQGRLTSKFGRRKSPFTRRWHTHRGIDIGITRRTAVKATADGVVRQAGRKGAYGKVIVIDHGNGIKTLFGHLSKIQVKVGEKVCRGEQIGLVGSTGRSTGPHLHYEVRVDREAVDPLPYLKLAGLFKLLPQ